MLVPLATYRLQLLPHLLQPARLAQALDYLRDLGIRDVYLSPCFRARSGSTHGYDVVSFSESLHEWGTAGDLQLRMALETRGMRAVLDMVPNHMAASAHENVWWRDVLRNGENSKFEAHFDIDWGADPERKLVLPILPAALDTLIEQGSIGVSYDQVGCVLVTPAQRLPLSPDSARPRAQADLLDRTSLRELLAAQHYRLVEAREGQRANYRRYLDVNELAALRMEDEAVFDATHRTLLGWVGEGWVSGLRIDHPDGLAAPRRYFERLREQAPDTWILAEKPIRPGAPLPAGWCVNGTTGYDFLALSLGLFVDPEGLRALEGAWGAHSGRPLQRFSELAAEGKRWALRELLAAELNRAAAAANTSLELTADERRHCAAALEELIVGLPVGRTLLEGSGEPSAEDQRSLQVAAGVTCANRPELAELAHRLVTALLYASDRHQELRSRFQQLSAAAGAKGVEDTAFYRYGALIALTELGCDPDDAAFSVEDFHAHAVEVLASRPHTMNTTSTHDTKRGEDARLRIAALSEMPDEFARALRRFRDFLPDPAAIGEPLQQHLLQTLIGAWPVSEQRFCQYALKAAREAKDFTSWRARNAAYEDALVGHVRSMLSCRPFIAELERFLTPLLGLARTYSLAQLLLKLTAPGVPDLYQGSELWEEHLVDPDNRCAVDFAGRRALLERARGLGCEQVREESDGTAKLWLLDRALAVRREHAAAFAGEQASYTPLGVTGRFREHVVAYARGERVVTVVPRLLGRAPNGLVATRVSLPGEGAWRDALSGRVWRGQSVDCAELLTNFPVALLVGG